MFAQKYLALELSDKTVRYCFLDKTSGGRLSLSQTGSVELGDGLFSSESFSRSLSEILQKIGTSRVKLFINILRRETLISSVILPDMPPAELKEVVSGEIVKVPSFFGKEFDFTYASYPYVDTKIRVTYCAIFHDLIKGILEAVQGQRVDLQEIALAPLSLLQSAYTWGENQAEQMLVVVGETSNYVVAFQNKQCKFFFSGSMGRSALFKTGACDKLSMLAWATDTNRIITSYFVAHGGQSVQKIFLIWDHEGAPDLAHELQEQLGKTVVTADLKSFPELEIKNDLDLNPAYMVALSPVVAFAKNYKSEFSFEKFLETFNYKDEVLKIAGQLGAFAAICVILIFSVKHFAYLENMKASSQLKQVKDKIKLLDEQNKKFDADLSTANSSRKNILAQITTVNNINRISWTHIFDEVVSRLPEGVSFTSFKVLDSDHVVIQGMAYSIETIGVFMRSLGDIKFLEGVQMGEIRDLQSDHPNSDESGRKIFKFEITAEISK